MEEHVIYDDDGKGFTKVLRSTDFDYADPIKYYSEHEINKVISIERDLLFMKNPALALQLNYDFFYARALKRWEKMYKQIISTEVPENFIKLLSVKSKKEQVKLLRGQSINPDQLIAYIFKAWSDYGFSFSQYTAQHHYKGLDKNKLPKLINIEDGTVKTVGETDLTDGQLKQVINHRKVTVSKFFDKGDEWHCFFLTYKSLRGEESWKGGQAHLHYISDKYGIPRDEVVNRLKSEKYPSTSVHIDLLDYGNQTIKE